MNISTLQETLELDWGVLRQIINTVGALPAESGGVLAGAEENIADLFYFDETSKRSHSTYSPDCAELNRLFRDEWNPRGIRLRGFVHSHPGELDRPSQGDEIYAERILSAIEDLKCLWLPIVNFLPDGVGLKLTPWVVRRGRDGVIVEEAKVRIANIPESEKLQINGVECMDQLRAQLEASQNGGIAKFVLRLRPDVEAADCRPQTFDTDDADCETTTARDETPSKNSEDAEGANRDKANPSSSDENTVPEFERSVTFDRVRDAYDLDRMGRSLIIAVGAGGAAEWLEAMARAGVGAFILIDPDIVSETNLATQQTYRKDLNRPKVECIAERLQDINPDVRVLGLQSYLDDLDDERLRSLVETPIPGFVPGRVLLCGFTDSFAAQARVNRLALKFGIPSLSAQVYQEGRGAEVTFTYPGITPACNRCILSSRYRHIMEKGEQHGVTSHGTPIFATTRLNALKGFVALALLHHGTDHPRWGDVLKRIGNRNLIQIRMDPDFSHTIGIRVFDKVFEGADRSRLFFDEVVWLPQTEESTANGYDEPCPDCGGTGDLRAVIGQPADTRVLIPYRSEAAKVLAN